MKLPQRSERSSHPLCSHAGFQLCNIKLHQHFISTSLILGFAQLTLGPSKKTAMPRGYFTVSALTFVSVLFLALPVGIIGHEFQITWQKRSEPWEKHLFQKRKGKKIMSIFRTVISMILHVTFFLLMMIEKSNIFFFSWKFVPPMFQLTKFFVPFVFVVRRCCCARGCATPCRSGAIAS